MSRAARRALLAATILLAAGAAGCPRLPPLPPRPAARLVGFDLAASPAGLAATAPAAGLAATARLDIESRGEHPLVLAAIDWELAAGDQPIQRGRAAFHRAIAPGRAATVDLALAVPAALVDSVCRAVAARRLRLRGTAHLERRGGAGAPAPFDELARPSRPGPACAADELPPVTPP